MFQFFKIAIAALALVVSSGVIASLNAGRAVAAPVTSSTVPPQKAGVQFGPPVDGSVKHGAYNGRTPFAYPANLNAAVNGKVLSTKDALARVRLDQSNAQSQGLQLHGINLVRWADIEKRPYTHGASLFFISPDRLVYEAVTKFNNPYSYKGNTWSSGTRTFVIDAATGDALYGNIQGHLTHSDHSQMMRPLTNDYHTRNHLP